MIKSFRDKDTRNVFLGNPGRKFRAIAGPAQVSLDILNAAKSLDDLRAIRSNRLEKLKGDRAGQFSIRVNDQYRICFRWIDNEPHDVELVDYH